VKNAPVVQEEDDDDADEETPLFIAAGVATCVALFFASRFSRYLPITEGWVYLERWWSPLAALNTVFHEAGHWIFGLLGVQWIRIAGGTLMQLLLPMACLIHFWQRRSIAGVMFVVFWIGLNLAEISWYAADAKLQALILMSGLSGQEGGGHDWNYLLGGAGLLDQAVLIGRLFFFSGLWLMVFAPAWGGAMAWGRWRART
jgi:hypothetical protein